MIPSDIANALRTQLPDQAKIAADQPRNQPVAPAQRLSDALTNLVPGQRIMAEVQALLPNGTYRATVAQRDVTLALPFAAKPGDSLELEVAESNGKLTLAFVANHSTGNAKTLQESVPTSLSAAGKLIGDLVAGSHGDGKRAPAAPLNSSQPMVTSMPDKAAELAPILKQALTQSGMFYEAHQAKWVAGKLPVEALQQEPQGKHARPPAIAAVDAGTTAKIETSNLGSFPQQSSGASADSQVRGGENPIPRDLAPLVRQQLEGLASSNFAWQGQIWPGQQMWWEIGENPDQRRQSELAQGKEWQSRLKLSLPSLGDIDATLRLQPSGHINLSVLANSPDAETRLRRESEQLIKQLSAAGLKIAQIQIQHGQTDE